MASDGPKAPNVLPEPPSDGWRRIPAGHSEFRVNLRLFPRRRI